MCIGRYFKRRFEPNASTNSLGQNNIPRSCHFSRNHRLGSRLCIFLTWNREIISPAPASGLGGSHGLTVWPVAVQPMANHHPDMG